LGKKDLIKKIPFKKFSLKIPSKKKVAAADCFAAWDIAFYYIDVIASIAYIHPVYGGIRTNDLLDVNCLP
jgi:hypothetical protein